jgi:hypothetical protein
MEVIVRHVKELAERVWEGELGASDASIFGKALLVSGDTSVVLVDGPVEWLGEGGPLSFDHARARVLNKGASGRAIFVAQGHSLTPDHEPSAVTGATSGVPSVGGGGDQMFLDDLASRPELREIGERLLAGIRARSGGTLRLLEQSGKYVETPDNFWTVKIQPRDGSLRVTVRGRPPELPHPSELDIKPDRPSYSNFKIKTLSQVDAAVRVVLAARRKD